MRVYTATEQDLLRRLNNGEGTNLYSLIDPWISGIGFTVDVSNNNVEIILDQNILTASGLSFQSKIQEIQIILLQFVNLIKLFEDKGYVFIFKSTGTIPNPFVFGLPTFINPSPPYRFPDSRISELIAKYATQEIFVTPELNQFVTVDRFRTREAVRADRQYRVTLTALIVAILALFSNLVFNILNQ